MNKSKMTEKPKKKRGRKSKIDNQQNNLPIFEDKINSDLILKLEVSNDKKIEKKQINKSNSNDTYKNINYTGNTKSEICWNCSHKLTNIVSMPINYNNGIYNTFGDFCSYSCCMRYAYDTFIEKKFLEIKHYINNLSNTNIKLPPSKYTLKIYGGILTQEEYTKSEDNYKIELNDNIYIGYVINKKKKNVKIENNDYVLYRQNKNTVQINDLLNNVIN